MKTILLFSALLCCIGYAQGLRIESISIKDSGQLKEFDMHRGDYIVEVAIRNISKKPIQVAQYSVRNYFRLAKVSNTENKVKYGTDFHKNNSICCHPPVFDVIAPNQIYTLFFRDSSRNTGKEMFLQIRGRQGNINIGRYILELTKKDNPKDSF